MLTILLLQCTLGLKMVYFGDLDWWKTCKQSLKSLSSLVVLDNRLVVG